MAASYGRAPRLATTNRWATFELQRAFASARPSVRLRSPRPDRTSETPGGGAEEHLHSPPDDLSRAVAHCG